MTQAQLDAYLTTQAVKRQKAKHNTYVIPSDVCKEGQEVADLHAKILAWCRAKIPFVPFIYNRPDKRSTAYPGSPDFILFWQGHVWLLECKTRQGQLSPEQMVWHLAAEHQGHKVHIIRAYSEFLLLVASVQNWPKASPSQHQHD